MTEVPSRGWRRRRILLFLNVSFDVIEGNNGSDIGYRRWLSAFPQEHLYLGIPIEPILKPGFGQCCPLLLLGHHSQPYHRVLRVQRECRLPVVTVFNSMPWAHSVEDSIVLYRMLSAGAIPAIRFAFVMDPLAWLNLAATTCWEFFTPVLIGRQTVRILPSELFKWAFPSVWYWAVVESVRFFAEMFSPCWILRAILSQSIVKMYGSVIKRNGTHFSE